MTRSSPKVSSAQRMTTLAGAASNASLITASSAHSPVRPSRTLRPLLLTFSSGALRHLRLAPRHLPGDDPPVLATAGGRPTPSECSPHYI